jgi:hypothetical protein
MIAKTRIATVCALLTAAALAAALAAPAVQPPVRITAMAVNMGSPGPSGSATVEIVVNRWSSESERDRLLAILLEKGSDDLLDALRDTPRVGYIRTPNSLGYDLHFARHTPGEDGGDRIVIATDRYIGYWEASRRPRSIDYPFTFIELRIRPDGEGEGKMSLATKIIADKRQNLIVLEDYATQPVLLQSVRVQPKSDD